MKHFFHSWFPKRPALLCLVLLFVLAGIPTFAKDTKEEKQQKLREQTESVLQQLYRVDPRARQAISESAGYAVFSNQALKILIAGSGHGQGMAVNNHTAQETFMKMIELQAGLGFGVKKFSLIFVFGSEKALSYFTSAGWEYGAQSTTALKTASQGFSLQGARLVSPGVWVYQLTDSGLALELTAKGAKFYKDGRLN